MEQCKFQLAWIGQCKEISNNDFCDKHIKEKCHKCGEQSLGECEEDVGSFVCGFPLCKNKCHNHNY